MAEERVLRVRRIDASEDESDYVLLKVTSNGSGTLDIKIVGTEGASPFVGSSKSLRASHDAPSIDHVVL